MAAREEGNAPWRKRPLGPVGCGTAGLQRTGGGPGGRDPDRRCLVPHGRAGAARRARLQGCASGGQGDQRRRRGARAAAQARQPRRQVRSRNGRQRRGRAGRPGCRSHHRTLRLRFRQPRQPRGAGGRSGRRLLVRLGPALQLLDLGRQAVHALDVEHHHGGDRGRVRVQREGLEDRLRRHRPVHRLHQVALQILPRPLPGARR